MQNNPITEIDEIIHHHNAKLPRDECIAGIRAYMAKRLDQIRAGRTIHVRERGELIAFLMIYRALAKLDEDSRWDEDNMLWSMESVVSMLAQEPLTDHWPLPVNQSPWPVNHTQQS